MGDEGFDQIAAGVFDSFGTAEMGGVCLNEGRIEVVLADQQAKLVAEPLGLPFEPLEPFSRLNHWNCENRSNCSKMSALRGREPTEFLDRAEADAVGFAESAIDGPGFGDAHFGAADKRRDVGRIGIAIADESL